MNKDLRTIKQVHLLFITGIALAVIGGSVGIKDVPFFQTEMARAQIERMFYTAELSKYGKGNALFGLRSYTAPEKAAASNEKTVESIPILVYHGVLKEDDGSDINFTQEEFKDHMFALKKAGYESLSLSELEAFMDGRFIPKGKHIMITFDDGRRDSYYGGDPVLAAVDFNAVMYAIGKYSQGNTLGGYYLAAPELRTMTESGRWEIGSHSYEGHDRHADVGPGEEGYFFSSYKWIHEEGRPETHQEFRERIIFDFQRSQDVLETIVEKPIRTLAFPFGDIGQNSSNVPGASLTNTIIDSTSLFYDLYFYQNFPGEFYTQVYPDPTAGSGAIGIRRIIPQREWNGEDLVRYLERGSAKPLPYQDSFIDDKGWMRTWGVFSIENGALFLRPEMEERTGASTILDGTAHWEDYEITARVRAPEGSGALIFVRFRTDRNNAACNFGKEFTHVEQIVNGEKRVIKGVREPELLPQYTNSTTTTTLTVRVKDRTVSCMIDGREVVSTEFLDPSLKRGGVGFKTWREVPNTTRLYVTDMKVTPL